MLIRLWTHFLEINFFFKLYACLFLDFLHGLNLQLINKTTLGAAI